MRHEAVEERKGPHGCVVVGELGADGSVEAGGEAHRREAGVGALVHRAAAGVVLFAAQQEAELSHPDDRSDDAERRVGALEARALLDVRLEEAEPRAGARVGVGEERRVGEAGVGAGGG